MELANITPDVVRQIKCVIEQARHNVAETVNNELLRSYWQVGKLIVENERSNEMNEASARSYSFHFQKL